MSLRCTSLYTFSDVYPVLCLPYGAVWYHMVKGGAVRCHMVKAGAIQCHMVKADAVRCHTVNIGVIEMWVTIPSDVRCVGL
jgi:hypothetical protein